MSRISRITGIISLGMMVLLVCASTAAAQESKKITLRYTSQSSPKGVRSEAVQWWASEIEKRSKGAVEVKFFWSGSLLKAPETMEGVGKGTANVGEAYGVYHPAKTPLWTVADTPFSHDDPYVGLKVMDEMFKSYNPMVKELEKYNVKLLMPFVTGMTELGTTKKPVLVPDDVKGLKIRFAGGEWAKFWESCGAVPLTVTQSEVYEALMRGTADGTQSYTFILEAYKHWDVLKYYTLLDAGELCSYGLVINLDLWKSFSPELKAIFTKVSDEFIEKYARDLIAGDQRILKEAEEKGVKVYRLNDEQRAKWKAKAAPLAEEWVKDKESKGLPGKETMDLFIRLRDKYQQEVVQKGYPWGK
jgi:TRAP-type C4-dicarboxylate transport system substrate-binding protein